jgi:hypothetical protein
MKTISMPKLNKNTIMLLVLILLLILCLVYIDNITTYINNLLHTNNDKFSDLPGYNNTSNYAPIEGFTDIAVYNDTQTDSVMESTSNREYKVAVDPKKKNIKVEFQKVLSSEIDANIKELGYLIVLAKYNNRLEKIGHVDAKISKEGVDIEEYIKKYNTIFDNDAKKEELRTLMRDINSATALSVLQFGSSGVFNGMRTASQRNLLVNDTTETKVNAYFDLLKIIYDAKFYKRSLKVEPGSNYNTGIYDLYNDLRGVFPILAVFNATNKKTPTTAFATNLSSDDILDEKYNLIKKNGEDAEYIVGLNNIDAHEKIKEFLGNYIEKYKSLTISIDDEKIGAGICNRDGICSYTFENLEDKDANGEFYYYKLGFGFIYNRGSGSSNYVESVSRLYTYKFGAGNTLMYFKLDNSLEEQANLLKRLAEIEKSGIIKDNEKVTQPMVNDVDESAGMNEYMKMLKPHIGNYPSEFTLREQDVSDLSLSDYLNKSVNAGSINIGINVNDVPVYDDTTTTVAVVTD